jgi:hypothetical protein
MPRTVGFTILALESKVPDDNPNITFTSVVLTYNLTFLDRRRPYLPRIQTPILRVKPHDQGIRMGADEQ